MPFTYSFPPRANHRKQTTKHTGHTEKQTTEHTEIEYTDKNKTTDNKNIETTKHTENTEIEYTDNVEITDKKESRKTKTTENKNKNTETEIYASIPIISKRTIKKVTVPKVAIKTTTNKKIEFPRANLLPSKFTPQSNITPQSKFAFSKLTLQSNITPQSKSSEQVSSQRN